jgi:hypothetical protein
MAVVRPDKAMSVLDIYGLGAKSVPGMWHQSVAGLLQFSLTAAQLPEWVIHCLGVQQWPLDPLM